MIHATRCRAIRIDSAKIKLRHTSAAQHFSQLDDHRISCADIAARLIGSSSGIDRPSTPAQHLTAGHRFAAQKTRQRDHVRAERRAQRLQLAGRTRLPSAALEIAQLVCQLSQRSELLRVVSGTPLDRLALGAANRIAVLGGNLFDPFFERSRHINEHAYAAAVWHGRPPPRRFACRSAARHLKLAHEPRPHHMLQMCR